MKTLFKIIIAVLVIGGIGAWYWFMVDSEFAPARMADYKNTTYTIDGTRITLQNGHAESRAATQSSSRVVTQYFGNEATGDINGDGIPDVAFLLTQSTGGSGTFYYVVGALKTPTGYTGTSAVLLGDRVAPQTTQITDGNVIVNYADRSVGEPMTTQPSVGKSLTLRLDPLTLQFGEVAQNFEGEADPSRMTLDMHPWTWVKTVYNNDTSVTPKRLGSFTITFNKDPFASGGASFSATTDCNRVSGTYSASQTHITFGKMVSTLMACADSQEQIFTKALSQVQNYYFTSKGELILDLALDTGTMTFH